MYQKFSATLTAAILPLVPGLERAEIFWYNFFALFLPLDGHNVTRPI